jgi:hypothetical protein
VLAGHLPDQFAYRAHAGLSHPSYQPKCWWGRMMTASCLASFSGKPVRPPVFLRSFVALAKFMRLSLVKAAHAVVSSAAYRKSGFRDRPWAFFLNN